MCNNFVEYDDSTGKIDTITKYEGTGGNYVKSLKTKNENNVLKNDKISKKGGKIIILYNFRPAIKIQQIIILLQDPPHLRK